MGPADSSPGSLVLAPYRPDGGRLTYFATASSPEIEEAMRLGKLGVILTYAHMRHPEGTEWVMDNGCFGFRYPYPGDDVYLQRLSEMAPVRDRCRFVTAPDVVNDPEGTLKSSLPMLPRIRDLGFPVAYVAQDGIEDRDDTPWDLFDVLFIGGSTGWKTGKAAEITRQALDRGKPVHMGRVNTLRRLRHAQVTGCASADGTYLRYGPDKNLPRLLRFLAKVNAQPPLDLD